MKFKNLLSLSVMLSCGLVAQAQVLQETFDAAQTKAATDAGYYEFINLEEGDEWKLDAAVGQKGGSLSISNTADKEDDNSTWMRAVKFRNLKLEEGKSYRLSYYIKGTSTYGDNKATKAKVGLMQGVENADIAVNGSEANISNITDEFVKHTHVFYFKSKSEQDAKYDEQCGSKEAYDAANKDKYFAVFNVYNPGEFNLDEVLLEEAAVAGVTYNGDVIAVDLGHATNAATLAAAVASGNLVLDNSTASVTVDGKAVDILSVELRKDGKLYIFLKDAVSGGEVKISFKNPDGLIQCTDGYVLDEISETAVLDTKFNEDGNILSDAYSEPSFVSATPLDGSFALESKNLKTITVTFDRPVWTIKNAVTDAPVATISNGEMTANLTLKTTDELAKTLTFEYNGADLADGTYSITLKNIANEYCTEITNPVVLTYEIGQVQLAETTYTLLSDNKTQTDAEGGIPEGWKITLQKEGEEAVEHAGGSGTRGFLYTNSNVQSAVYMRDWEGKAVLTSSPVKIPAGNVELRAYNAGWATTGKFKMTLKNSAGEEVLAETIVVSTQLGKDRTGNFQVDAFKFVSDGGEYTYTLELDGSNELLAAGFEVYSYEVSGGSVFEPEVIAEGNFAGTSADYTPAHGTGWKIYRNDNRMRDPGANCNWGGDDWTGGGGPRVKSLGNKGMNGGGIYLAGGCYATYGEYLLQTDHAGTIEPEAAEKTLDLSASRYQVSYYIIGWKDPGETYNIQLDIYKQEEGIAGTPVYTRIDGVTQACGSGNDASSDATKISFLWNAPTAGKYVLKFTASGAGEGEAVLGNVSVETTASLAIQYASEMQKNLTPAKEELELALAKDEYKGATRDLLAKTIEEYSAPDFHTVAEYTAAFENLDALVKKSAKRRSNIDNFAKSLESVKEGLDAAIGTKYEALPQYPIVEKAYSDYKDVDYVAMNDDDLDAAVTVMSDNGSLLTNMVNKCVPLLTKQITDIAAAIVKLDAEAENHEYVIAAGNVINDDQSVVKALKSLYLAKLYKAMAEGNPFKTVSEVVEEDGSITTTEEESSIDVSFLIQNANFYSTAVIPAGKQSVEAKTTDFPGWTIDVISGSITPVFNTAWGEVGATAVKPIENCAVKTGWGTHEYDVKQLITMLPVAKYTASIKIGEDGGDPHGAYAYIGEGDAQQTSVYEAETYTRDNNTPQEFTDVTPTIEGNCGSLVLGAHINVAGGFGKVDDAALVITAKADGFDYAKAAEAYATSINVVEAAPAGEPANVKYYTIDGKQTVNPQGVSIKVETWANGYTKVSKVVK